MYLDLDPVEILAAYRKNPLASRYTGRMANFNTVVTLKGREAKLFAEIVQRMFRLVQ